MLRLFKKLFHLTLLIFLSCCVTNLKKLSQEEQKLKREGFYSSYLALEYLQYSRQLLEDDDFFNSEYFAKKGLEAVKGFDLIPENPRYWGVNPSELEDFITAQKRYQKIAKPKVQTLLPIQMAHLLFLYDCWVTKDIKPAFRYGTLNKCKDRFYQLLEEVEDYVYNYSKPKGKKVEIVEPVFSRYLILFDFNSYKINSEANRKIIEVLKIIDSLDGNYSIVLVGNADRVGKKLFNERLSRKRALAVKQYLEKNGVAKDAIEVRAAGEELPDLITKDNVRQQFNRTVQIYLVKNLMSVRDIPLPVLYQKTYKQEIERYKVKRGLK